MVPWSHPDPYPRRRLGRFIRFCRPHGFDQQSHVHEHTHHATSVSTGCIYRLMHGVHAMRPINPYQFVAPCGLGSVVE